VQTHCLSLDCVTMLVPDNAFLIQEEARIDINLLDGTKTGDGAMVAAPSLHKTEVEITSIHIKLLSTLGGNRDLALLKRTQESVSFPQRPALRSRRAFE
jgi:hypothetical protein